MGLNKYIFTNEEFKNLKYVGSNPDIVSTSGLTEMVNENTLDISNLQSDNEINKDNITSLSTTTQNKTDLGHHHLTADIDDLSSYDNLLNYLPNVGGEIDGDLTVTGKLAVNGGIITVSSTTVTTTSNVIKLNEGEAGAGVTAGSSGVEVNRGSLPRYEFKFYENNDTFRIGLTGNTQAIATRDDNPTNNYIPTWDDTNKIFTTSINPNTLSLTSHTHTTTAITDLNNYDEFVNYYKTNEIDGLLTNKTNTGTTLIISNNVNDISGKTTTNTNNINIISGNTTNNSNNISSLSATTITNSSNIVTLSGNTLINSNNINIISGNTSTNITNISIISGDTTTNKININTLSANTLTLSATTLSQNNNIVTLSANTSTNISNINIISGNTTTNTNNITSLSALTLTKVLDDRTVGCITIPTLTDNNNGTATITSTTVFLRDNPNHLGQINQYTVSGGTFSFIDGNEEYIAVKYNGGSPIMYKETSGGTINNSDIIPVFTCWRQGTVIHSLNFDSLGIGLSNKIQSSEYHKSLYARSTDGGLILGESLTPTARTITVSSSVVYVGAIPITLNSYNSSIDKLTQSVITNGTWSYTNVNVYNNTQYNPSTGLATLGNNSWSVVWFYRSVGDDNQVFYVLGDTDYNNEAAANTSIERTDLPMLLKKHCILIGRILIEKNTNSGTVQSSFNVTFSSSNVINHNDTNNKQGGGLDEYFHLTNTDYTDKILNRRFGNVSGGTYTEFESTGFQKMSGSSVYWRDIDFPIVIRTTGANIPSYQTLQGNLTIPRWAVNDFYQCDGQEFVHEWLEGSTCYWHVHMITNGTDTTDRFVKWEIEYTWVNVNGQLSTNTTTSFEHTITANTLTKTMQIVNIANFTPAAKIGGHVFVRLRRIASTGAAPTNDPFCGMLQLHIQCDTLGSRNMASK